jgi:hypothetical protein
LVVLLAFGMPARAETVGYTANLSTSRGNPVTQVLILEEDAAGNVHGQFHAAPVPGTGTVVIAHDVPFHPVKSLLIGVTDGQDENGDDKTQLVMFLAPDFAAANAGVPFSSVFPGARHSATIDSLDAAAAGDAASLAWFTEVFFSGPAAGAVFATGGAFAVAEFTALKSIGNSATAGNWMINSFSSIPRTATTPVTAVIDETAKVDTGPFDIELTLDGDGLLAIEKTVTNNTGADWLRFEMRLGTGTGDGFTPSQPSDGLQFAPLPPCVETTGGFPNVTFEEDRVVFTGRLAAGGTAHFVVYLSTTQVGRYNLTLRQIAAAVTVASAPALSPSMLVVLVALLSILASVRIGARR